MIQGSDIRIFRVARRMSQAELGQKARITQTRVSQLERGLEATPDEVKRIMKVLGMDVSMKALTGGKR